MTRLLRLLAAFAAPLVMVLILGAPLSASALQPPAAEASVQNGVQDFTFTSYSADYYLARDAKGHSTLRTVETIVAKFPNFDQNRGIIRAIPNDYDGVPLHTAVVSVTDARGAPVHFDATDNGGFTELALGTDDYVHGTQSYVITYTQQNVVRSFPDTGDELYWDTNGTGFAQPFGSVTARVHVDPAIAEFLTGNNSCYWGAQGSTTACLIEQSADDATAPGGQLFTARTSGIGPRENLTVAIGFTTGTFVQVPAEEKPSGEGYPGGFPGGGNLFGGSNPFDLGQMPWWSNVLAFLLLGLSGFGAVFAVVQRVFLGKRNAKGRGIIIPQYSVPKGLTLLEAANLIGKTENGLSAQLVSFAVRGNIHILDYPVSAAGNDYTLQFVSADGASSVESRLLGMLFGAELVPGATREIGVQNDALARQLGTLKASVAESMIARGLKAKASVKGGVFVLLGLILLLVGSIFAAVLSVFNGAFNGWVFAAIPVAFVCVLVAAGAAIRPSVLTDAGAEQRDYLLGMRDYLQLAEADRFRMLQSPEGAERVDVGDKIQLVKLYEKLLPFAVLWGIEREWSKELAVYYEAGVSSPDWYVSSSAFNAAMFAHTLGGLATSVTTTATPVQASSWSGSSGGSFSGGSFGGGFSGGGGGGGGGGGR